MDILREGVPIRVNSSFKKSYRTVDLSTWPREEVDFLEKEMNMYIATKTLEEFYGDPDVVAAYRLVNKKGSSKYRMVVNLRPLNKYCSGIPDFKYKTLKKCLELLLTNEEFCATFDLKAGYHQVRVKKEDRSKLVIEYNGKLYCFTVLPFGWNGSPFYFTIIMNELVRLLAKEDFILSNYLDDFFTILGEELEKAQELIEALAKALLRFGLILEPTKYY